MIWPPWNWLFGLPGTVPLAADGRDLDNYAIWTTTCPTLRSDWDQAGRGDVRPQGARAVDGGGGPRRSRCHGGRSLGVPPESASARTVVSNEERRKAHTVAAGASLSSTARIVITRRP